MWRIGIFILAGAWLPLAAVNLVEPGSDPTALALLGATGNLVGGVFFALGLLGPVFEVD